MRIRSARHWLYNAPACPAEKRGISVSYVGVERRRKMRSQEKKILFKTALKYVSTAMQFMKRSLPI
jgi:hypothetical protein